MRRSDGLQMPAARRRIAVVDGGGRDDVEPLVEELHDAVGADVAAATGHEHRLAFAGHLGGGCVTRSSCRRLRNQEQLTTFSYTGRAAREKKP